MLITHLFPITLLISVAIASSLRIRLEQLDIAHEELKKHFMSQLTNSSELIEKSDKYFEKLSRCTAANGASTNKSDKAEIRERLKKYGTKVEDCIREMRLSSKLRANLLERLTGFQKIAEVIIFSRDEKPSSSASSPSHSASLASIIDSMETVSLSSLRAESMVKPSSSASVVQPSTKAQPNERDLFLCSIASTPQPRQSLKIYSDFFRNIKSLSKKEQKKRLPKLVQDYLKESSELSRPELPDLSEANPESYNFLFEALDAQVNEIKGFLKK